MKTAKLTRYRLRWLKEPGGDWALLFGGQAMVARVFATTEPPGWMAALWPAASGYEVAYEGPSVTQAKRAASMAIRLFMCREVDEATVLGKRVKKGRVRR